ncbi:hypothetical protein BJF84_05375 [Rhodococcus sp. CUA-806]|nr:hypothetical protein BJF84_05375 [Rhodococcus sp. CUA-806]
MGFLLLIVVPGIVFTAVRRQLRGPTPEDQDFSVRLINAIVASIVFASVYLIVLGPILIHWMLPSGPVMDELQQDSPQRLIESKPREFGLLVLTFAIGVPAILGLIAHLRRPEWKWFQCFSTSFAKMIKSVLRVRVSSAPSAWDEAAPSRADCFVRIYTSDERWVGGYIPENEGYIATFPHPRDIFIPQQWKMAEDGEFVQAIDGSLGIYIPLAGGERVEWVQPPADPDNDPNQLTLF